LLGKQYGSLTDLIPLAVSLPLLALLGDILYILLMSRGWTKGQNWTIYLGVGVQAIYIYFTRVETTRAALLLIASGLLTHVGVQLVLLLKNITTSDLNPLGALQGQIVKPHATIADRAH
jgi:hypothetical protein